MIGAPPGSHPPQGARPGPACRGASGYPWRRSPAAGEQAPRRGSAGALERGEGHRECGEGRARPPRPAASPRHSHEPRGDAAAARRGKKDPLPGLSSESLTFARRRPGKSRSPQQAQGLGAVAEHPHIRGKRCYTLSIYIFFFFKFGYVGFFVLFFNNPEKRKLRHCAGPPYGPTVRGWP